MIRLDYEKTQKNNPHQLTINQHWFPARSISRFAKHEGSVQVFLLKNNIVFDAKPNNEIFCVKRAWDQRAESRYMKEVESNYQILADDVVSRKVSILKNDHHGIVTKMYLLWFCRWHWATKPFSDIKLEGVKPPEDLSKNTQECLEKAGITSIGSDMKVVGRSFRGIKIQQCVDIHHETLSGVHWGIIISKDGEFLVPDISSIMIIPLTPNMCFVANCDSGFIEDTCLKQINLINLQGSSKYYFARDFSKCLLPK